MADAISPSRRVLLKGIVYSGERTRAVYTELATKTEQEIRDCTFNLGNEFPGMRMRQG
jgi:hypothetical protein